MKAKKNRGKKGKAISEFEAYRKIRKPMPPPTKVINPKKKYDRKDKTWADNIDNMDNMGEE